MPPEEQRPTCQGGAPSVPADLGVTDGERIAPETSRGNEWAGKTSALAFARLLLREPGTVVELRAPTVRRGTYTTNASGYFDDPEKLVAAAASIDGTAVGVYVTPNPVRPELLARASNRLAFGTKTTTADSDVLVRRFLLVDMDPARPSGISSTAKEKEAARAVAHEIRAFLLSLGFPEPIEADSGNGAHLLYLVDLPSDDGGLIQRSLQALAFRFDTDKVRVDQSVHNPARIWKLYGTLACKGDSTPDRPHRRSALVKVPEELQPIPIELLRTLAERAPSPSTFTPRGNGHVGPFDVDSYLVKHGLNAVKHGPWQGGRRWVLERCPFGPEHADGSAFVVQLASGALGAGCHHNSCAGKKWPELRDAVDPGWRERQQSNQDKGNTSKSKLRGRKKPSLAAYAPFPTEVLPEPVRSFVLEGSAAIGCDPAFIVMPLIAALASAIGNTRRIRLKPGWFEPAILWTAIVGESGSQKSPGLDLTMKPLQDLQDRAFEQFAREKEAYEIARLEYERALTKWKRGKSKEDPPEKPKEPVPMRYFVSDTTVEALAVVHDGQWRGLFLARDELAGWLRSFNQYKKAGGGDTAHWLEMHGGRPMAIDRKTGPQKLIYIPRASVSLTGGIQPGTLKRCLDREHFEDGLAARILLALPTRKPKRWTEISVSPESQAAIDLVFAKLFQLEPDKTQEGKAIPGLVGLTPEAKRLWIQFYNAHGAEQADLTGDVAAAWSKLEGYAARLALVIHLVRWANGEGVSDKEVDKESIAAGVRLSQWFGQEAKRIYAIIRESGEDEELRERVEMIERKGGKVTVRGWQRARCFESAEGAEAELEELVQAKLGEWTQTTPGPKGGRPPRLFTLTRKPGDRTSGADGGNAAGEDADGVSSVSVSSVEVWSTSEEVSSVVSGERPGDEQSHDDHRDVVVSQTPADTTDTDTTPVAAPPEGFRASGDSVSSAGSAEWGEV